MGCALKCFGILYLGVLWKHLSYPYWDKTVLIILNDRFQLHDIFN